MYNCNFFCLIGVCDGIQCFFVGGLLVVLFNLALLLFFFSMKNQIHLHLFFSFFLSMSIIFLFDRCL